MAVFRRNSLSDEVRSRSQIIAAMVAHAVIGGSLALIFARQAMRGASWNWIIVGLLTAGVLAALVGLMREYRASSLTPH